jgi:hypothetical protein
MTGRVEDIEDACGRGFVFEPSIDGGGLRLSQQRQCGRRS